METLKPNYGYRVNQKHDGSLIGIEIICCSKHIGEIRFKDGEALSCPECGIKHKLKIHHNHFHIDRED